MKRENYRIDVILTVGPTGGVTYSGLTQMLLHLTPSNLLLVWLLKSGVKPPLTPQPNMTDGFNQ